MSPTKEGENEAVMTPGERIDIISVYLADAPADVQRCFRGLMALVPPERLGPDAPQGEDSGNGRVDTRSLKAGLCQVADQMSGSLPQSIGYSASGKAVSEQIILDGCYWSAEVILTRGGSLA